MQIVESLWPDVSEDGIANWRHGGTGRHRRFAPVLANAANRSPPFEHGQLFSIGLAVGVGSRGGDRVVNESPGAPGYCCPK